MNEPVVLIHGLFGPFCEAAAIAALRPAAVTAPGLLGYGGLAGAAITVQHQVQALQDHIRERHQRARVHLVGHSIGAVYAFHVADAGPEMVASLTTVEGNFSLADAFWSRSISEMDQARAEASITLRLQDPAEFLAADGIEPTSEYLGRAREALAYQPWQTIWQSARAIVARISEPGYEAMLKRAFASFPVHLIAGERSSRAWHVPAWAREACASSTVVPGVGHMMMLEQPAVFGQSLRAAISA